MTMMKVMILLELSSSLDEEKDNDDDGNARVAKNSQLGLINMRKCLNDFDIKNRENGHTCEKLHIQEKESEG